MVVVVMNNSRSTVTVVPSGSAVIPSSSTSTMVSTRVVVVDVVDNGRRAHVGDVVVTRGMTGGVVMTVVLRSHVRRDMRDNCLCKMT